jgi:signal transduction histidine kinase
MGLLSYKQSLIAELSHEINSPLAAIRNALYLASCHTDDPKILQYLALADEEISSIAATLRASRAIVEHLTEAPSEQVAVAPATRRAAA